MPAASRFLKRIFSGERDIFGRIFERWMTAYLNSMIKLPTSLTRISQLGGITVVDPAPSMIAGPWNRASAGSDVRAYMDVCLAVLSKNTARLPISASASLRTLLSRRGKLSFGARPPATCVFLIFL